MKTEVTPFKKAFIAEQLKIKGTSIYTLSILISILPPIILFISRLENTIKKVPKIEHNAFTNFISVSLELFCFYILPLIIILTTSKITQLDHKNNGWQLMETLPVKKITNYFSKFFVVIINNVISVFTFILTSICLVYVLSVMGKISISATVNIPYSLILNLTIRLVIATLFLSALQYMISVVFSNYLIAVFIGVIGFSLNTYLNESNIFLNWYPYAALTNIFRFPQGSDLNHFFIYTDILSIIGGLFLLYIGFHWYKLKQFKFIFSQGKRQTIQSIFVLISLFILFIFVQKTQEYKPNLKTVLKGKITSLINFKTLTVVEPFTNETIVSIPISENQFNYEIEKKMPLNTYNIFLDNEYRSQIIFGTNDSIYIDFKIGNNINSYDVKGTRLAENLLKIRDEGSFASYWLENEFLLKNPEHFLFRIKKEWRDRVEGIKKNRTADNFKVREDFKNRYEILLIAEYHYYLKEYKKKIKLLFPEKIINIPNELKLLDDLIPYDESLLNNNFYLEVVLDQLAENKDEKIDRDTQILKTLSTIENSSFRDKLMFWQLNKSIQEFSKDEDINVLVDTYINKIQNTYYKSNILENVLIIRKLKKGSKAPYFKTETINGEIVTLDNLLGKYTIIDIWATWCIPCKKDAPYFEKYALKYSNKNIQFVSISIDDKKHRNDWILRVKELSSSVIQLRSLNKENFMKVYNISSIPQYLILDANGNILNIDLPKPSKSNFESIIKSLIPIEKLQFNF